MAPSLAAQIPAPSLIPGISFGHDQTSVVHYCKTPIVALLQGHLNCLLWVLCARAVQENALCHYQHG